MDKTQAKSPPTTEVRTRLFGMIGDADQQVRLKVLKTLVSLNDPQARDAMIGRLKIEKDPQLRLQLVTALGKLADPAAAGVLLSLLRETDLEIATEAAKAFAGDLGSSLHARDPQAARRVADTVRGLIDETAGRPGFEDFRAACVSASVAVQGPAAFADLMKLVLPGESPQVRRAALVGLGNVANNDADERIARQLDDRDPSIRLEAAKALGNHRQARG